MKIEMTPLSLSDIPADSTNLFVVNNTDLSRSRPKGVFHLVITDASNQEVQINLPKTWLPINLADYCDVPSILRSSKFKELVRRGIFLVISDEEARKHRSSSKGVAEIASVKAIENTINGVVSKALTDAPAQVVVYGNEGPAVSDPNAPPPAAEFAQQEVRLQEVVQIVQDFNVNNVDDEELATRIASIEGNKTSWIWAAQQINDTTSKTYEAISDKIGQFSD